MPLCTGCARPRTPGPAGGHPPRLSGVFAGMKLRDVVPVLVLVMVSACAPDGEAALWWPAPGEQVNAETQVLDVLVEEQECASGQLATGRVSEPTIERSDEHVVVTFRVRPVEGGADCPGNPPTPAELDLGEPLGNRQLLDGGKAARCEDDPDRAHSRDCDLRVAEPPHP